MSAQIRVNGREEPLRAATIAELLRGRGIEGTRGVAVAVNGAVVPARQWAALTLAADDVIEIVRPFGGG
jgi:sulfur carrier protein